MSPTNRVAWPFYLALDVSKSMQARRGAGRNRQDSPWELMQRALPDLLYQLEKSPTAADIAHLTIIAFSDDVAVYLPRTRIADHAVSLGKLPTGFQTNYAKLFSWLHRQVSADIAELSSAYRKVKRPALYMITDGEPFVDSSSQAQSAWVPELTKLQALHVSRPARPPAEATDLPMAVISLGFGDVSEGTLGQISQRPGGAFVAEDPDAQPDLLIPALISGILNSVLLSVKADEVEFPTPPGMRRID